MLDVLCESCGGLVTARAIFLQRFHHDPVEIPFERANQLGWLDLTTPARHSQICGYHGAQSRRGANGLLDLDHAPDLVKSCLEEFTGVKWRCASQQFVKQYTKTVNVGPRIYVQTRKCCLL